LNGFVTVIGMDSYPISPDPGLRNETDLRVYSAMVPILVTAAQINYEEYHCKHSVATYRKSRSDHLAWTPPLFSGIMNNREASNMSDGKAELEQELSEDEIVDAVADALASLGFAATPQDTGGGMNCVVLEHKDGGEIVWGTADVTWGASISGEDGEYISSLETGCPSDTRDIAAIVEAIKGPSLAAGAVVSTL
jgi:hypothetical protein